MTNETRSVIEAARAAESALYEEYKLMRQGWERNPTMEACAAGVKALRNCITLLEARSA